MYPMSECTLCGAVVPDRLYPSGMHDCVVLTDTAAHGVLGPVLQPKLDAFQCQVCLNVFPDDAPFKYETCTAEHEAIVQAAIDKVPR